VKFDKSAQKLSSLKLREKKRKFAEGEIKHEEHGRQKRPFWVTTSRTVGWRESFAKPLLNGPE
jgi:hypothetical protein